MWTSFLSRRDRKRLDEAREAASVARELARQTHEQAKSVVTAAERSPITVFAPSPHFPLPEAPAGRPAAVSALRRFPSPMSRAESMRRLTQQLTIDALDHEKSARDWERAARTNDPLAAGAPTEGQRMLAAVTGKASTWIDADSAVEGYRRSAREWAAAQGQWSDILFLWRQTANR